MAGFLANMSSTKALRTDPTFQLTVFGGFEIAIPATISKKVEIFGWDLPLSEKCRSKFCLTASFK